MQSAQNILKKIQNKEDLGVWSPSVRTAIYDWCHSLTGDLARDDNKAIAQIVPYLFHYLEKQLATPNLPADEARWIRSLAEYIYKSNHPQIFWTTPAIYNFVLESINKPPEKRIFETDYFKIFINHLFHSDTLELFLFLSKYFYPPINVRHPDETDFLALKETFDRELESNLRFFSFQLAKIDLYNKDSLKKHIPLLLNILNVVAQDAFHFQDRMDFQERINDLLQTIIRQEKLVGDIDCCEAVCGLLEKYPAVFSSDLIAQFLQYALAHHHVDIAHRLVGALYNKECNTDDPNKLIPVFISAVLAGDDIVKIHCYETLMEIPTNIVSTPLASLATQHKDAFFKLMQTPIIQSLKEQAKTNLNAADELGEIYYQAWLLEPSQTQYFIQAFHYTRCALHPEEEQVKKSAIDRMKLLHKKMQKRHSEQGGLDDEATANATLTNECLQLVTDITLTLDVLSLHSSRYQDEEEKVTAKRKELEDQLNFNHTDTIEKYRNALRKNKVQNIKEKLFKSIQETKSAGEAANSLWTLFTIWPDLDMQPNEISIIAKLLEKSVAKEQKDVTPFTPTLVFLFYKNNSVKEKLSEEVRTALLKSCLINFSNLSQPIQKQVADSTCNFLEKEPKFLAELSLPTIEQLFAINGKKKPENIRLLVRGEAHFPFRRRFYLELMGEMKNLAAYEDCLTIEALAQKAGKDFVKVFSTSYKHQLFNDDLTQALANSPEGNYERAELYYQAWKLSLASHEPDFNYLTSTIDYFRRALGENHDTSVLNQPTAPNQKILMRLLAIEREIARMRTQSQFAEKNTALFTIQILLQQYWIIQYRHFGVEDEKSIVETRLNEGNSREIASKQVREEAIVRKILDTLQEEKDIPSDQSHSDRLQSLRNLLYYFFKIENYNSPVFFRGMIEIVRTTLCLGRGHYLSQDQMNTFIKHTKLLTGGLDKDFTLQEQVKILLYWMRLHFHSNILETSLQETLKEKAATNKSPLQFASFPKNHSPPGEEIKIFLDRLEFLIEKNTNGAEKLIEECQAHFPVFCLHWIFNQPVVMNYVVHNVNGGNIKPAKIAWFFAFEFENNKRREFIFNFLTRLLNSTSEAKQDKENEVVYCHFLKECMSQNLVSLTCKEILNYIQHHWPKECKPHHQTNIINMLLHDSSNRDLVEQWVINHRLPEIKDLIVRHSNKEKVEAEICWLMDTKQITLNCVEHFPADTQNYIVKRIKFYNDIKNKKPAEIKEYLSEVFSSCQTISCPLPESKNNTVKNINFQRFKAVYQFVVCRLGDNKLEGQLAAVKEAAFPVFKIILKDQAIDECLEMLDDAVSLFSPPSSGPGLYRLVDPISSEMRQLYKLVLDKITKEPTHPSKKNALDFIKVEFLRVRAEMGIETYNGTKNFNKEAALACEWSVLCHLQNKLEKAPNKNDVTLLTIIDETRTKANGPARKILEKFKHSFAPDTDKRCLIM